MKLFLILYVLILVSCATKKELNSNISINNEINSTQIIDSIDTVANIQTTDTTSSVLEMIVTNELKRIKQDDIRQLNDKEQIKVIEKHEIETNLTVIDKSTENSDTTLGLIAYSMPEEMKVAKSYSIKVRISKKSQKNNKAVLIIGNGDWINNSEFKSIANIEDCRVSGEMSAELRASSDHFTIVELSTATQNIDTVSYTEWEWIVTPKVSGQRPIKLVIKLKDLNKDIVVFNRSISIKTNVNVAVKGFFESYWQWLMTTIIIPIFLYFWGRKKKRNQ